MTRRERREASNRSPWETTSGHDLLRRFDRTLRLAAKRGRRPLPRPEDERKTK